LSFSLIFLDPSLSIVISNLMNLQLLFLLSLKHRQSNVLLFQSASIDLTSYQRVFDGVMNKAQNLTQSGRDDSVLRKMNHLNDAYTQLCRLAKVIIC